MTCVSILPEPTEGGVSYRAVAGDRQSIGKTAGEALDALAGQLSEGESGTLVIVQNLRPDHYFDTTQQRRLAELMDRWRYRRDKGLTLSTEEQAELDALSDAELRASAVRAADLAQDLSR